MTLAAQDYEEYSTSVFSRSKYPPAAGVPKTGVGQDGEQRSRVLRIKDLARLEALVRDVGGE
jgi:hypothetical protein